MIPHSHPAPTKRRPAHGLLLTGLLSVPLAACAAQADPEHGDQLYQAQCAICHGPAGEGGQGPALGGVVGRKVAGADFSYTQALRKLDGRWDAERLRTFLANPQAMAPGTSMPMAVEQQQARADIVAFLGTLKPAVNQQAGGNGATADTGVFGGWRQDAPGKMHHIRLADLPAPAPETSASNSSRVVPRPAGAMPQVPDGFEVSVFAQDLQGPRILKVAPNGDVFVSEPDSGRIQVLVPSADGRQAARTLTFASGLDGPYGLAFYPAGAQPRWLYVAQSNQLVRYPYRPGQRAAEGKPEVIVSAFSPGTGGHSNRDLALSQEGPWFFVGVGSASNVADGMGTKSPAQARAWEATQGLGAAWGEEEHRAQVRAYSPDGRQQRAYATGIRNCSGLTVQPGTGTLWCSTNERDRLGDNLVPDYVTRVPAGSFFGWPWWYLGDHEDPRRAGERPDLKGKVAVPDVLLQAHSASLGMGFAPQAKLPADWRGSAFVAEHGSWNRRERTGPKLIRIPVDAHAAPTGRYQDVMTGFVVDDAHVWGRPAAVTGTPDGALLVSDDAGGVVWRLVYRAP